MTFSRLAVVSLLALSTGVEAAFERGIGASTKAGRRLLKKAQLVAGEGEPQTPRFLADEQAAYDGDDETWIAKMSLKYEGCYNTVILTNSNGNGNGNNNNNNNNNKNGNNNASPVYNQGVITFKLCANSGSKSCGSCMGGVYAVDMMDFVDAFTEADMESKEYQCEKAREDSGCYYDDDQDTCEQTYWTNLGMTYCIQDDESEDFQVQRYLECAKMNNGNGNNNNNKNNNYNYNNANSNAAAATYANGYQVYPNWDGAYRIGPYCSSDSVSIYLGVFYDAACSLVAGDGAYATLNSAQLPYSASSSKSIIPASACMPCIDQEQWDANADEYNEANGQDQQWANMEPLEFCVNSYEAAVKCTADDRSGCGFINKYLKALSANSKYVRYVGAPNNNAGIVFAWLFATTTAIFAGYTFYLFRKIKRGEVDIDYN